VDTIHEISRLGKQAERDNVLNNGRFASLNDESSTGNINLLLHELQLITSGFEQDMGH
jgi:hypothetical protein